MLYLNGLGVKADRGIAIHHLRSAHQLKVTEATGKLKELGVKIAEETPEVRQPPQQMRHSIRRGTETEAP